ncbi:ribosomal protein L10, putative [Nitrosococcus oceani AFC27]|nr:ribosomal protein L10, putative [Nitrosococcus oceani AFC27]
MVGKPYIRRQLNLSLNLEAKKAVVAEVAAVASQSHSAVAIEYRGLTVAEITKLRVAARKGDVYLRVVRNTLASRALEGTDFDCMREGLTGPLMLAFSREEPSAAARVIRDFGKEHPKLVVKMGCLGGRLLPPEGVENLAKMPTKEQAVAMLMGVLQAPIGKFARTLAEPTAKLVRTVAAVRDQKQAT